MLLLRQTADTVLAKSITACDSRKKQPRKTNKTNKINKTNLKKTNPRLDHGPYRL
jgi:hypothetical protein